NALLRAGRDDDRLRERAGGPSGDLRRHGGEVRRKARAVDVAQLSAEVPVLLKRELALDRELPEQAILLAEPRGLIAGGEEVMGPRVAVPERLRYALEPDGEGSQR